MSEKTTSIAYMNTDCSSFSVSDINIFDFSGNGIKEFLKNQNSEKLTIKKNNTKSYEIKFKCPVCDEEHSYVVPSTLFWSGEICTYSCPYYEADIVFLGHKDELEKTVKEYIKSDLSYETTPYSEFYNELFEKIINLNKIVEENYDKIKICNCNDKYTVAYNEKEIFLICNSCHKALPISYDKIDLFISTLRG